jgi:integrase
VAYFAREVWLKKKKTEVRERSFVRYRAVIDHFIDYLERERGMRSPTITAIGYEIAADYVAHRISTPLMPNGQKKFTRAFKDGAAKKTVHFEREVLFQMFKEAVKRELIRHNPFTDVKPKKPNVHEVAAVHHPLTVDEESSLLRAAEQIDRSITEQGNPKFRDIVSFLCSTGLREGEMRNLEWSDIDWKNGLIHVRQKHVQERRVIVIPETAVEGLMKRVAGKTADVPIFKDEADIEAFGVRLNIRGAQDLLSIKNGEVDLPNRRVVTTRTYSWKPKGANGVVPMCSVVRDLLAALAERKTSNFIFAHRDGGSCRVDILALLKKAQKLAGIKGRLRIHDLRHTLAIRLRRDKGVALETIMGILRHADIKETLIYAPYSLDEGRAAISRLDTPTASSSDPSASPVPPRADLVR